MAQTFQNVLIYEDTLARSRRFLPLTYTRSIAELRTGAFSALERVQSVFRGAQVYLHTRPELKTVITERYGLPVNEVPQGSTLLLNAREALIFNPNNSWYEFDEIPEDIANSLTRGEPIEPPGPIRDDAPASIWDIIHANAKAIHADVELWTMLNRSVERPAFSNCSIVKPENLLIHPSAEIGANVVLDCIHGEIIIEEAVRIYPNSTIIGPAFIGKNSLIKIGAKIYEGTSIGPTCKMGGEIETSIVQGFSNKQHDGYLGHSFLGEWVNLGAGTNTSDLKNDYSPVRVTIEGEEFNTGLLFIGLLMGDHSKSSIGTQFNSGTAVGVSCNIFDAGFPPKWIPNFSWGGAKELTTYRFDKAMAVAQAVMERRNRQLTEQEMLLLKALFDDRNRVEI